MTEKTEEAAREFAAAAYYCCRELDVITTTTVEEALEDYLEGLMSLGCDAEEVIRNHGSIEVKAYDEIEGEETDDGLPALEVVGSKDLEPDEVIARMKGTGYIE